MRSERPDEESPGIIPGECGVGRVSSGQEYGITHRSAHRPGIHTSGGNAPDNYRSSSLECGCRLQVSFIGTAKAVAVRRCVGGKLMQGALRDGLHAESVEMGEDVLALSRHHAAGRLLHVRSPERIIPELLERITAARSACMNAQTVNDKVAADNMLTSALAGLKVSVENYPDLKANQNFLQLQSELADIENKLAAVRRFFNSATKELNNSVQSFPNNLIANMFGFHKEPMFEVAPEQRAAIEKAPTVSF